MIMVKSSITLFFSNSLNPDKSGYFPFAINSAIRFVVHFLLYFFRQSLLSHKHLPSFQCHKYRRIISIILSPVLFSLCAVFAPYYLLVMLLRIHLNISPSRINIAPSFIKFNFCFRDSSENGIGVPSVGMSFATNFFI